MKHTADIALSIYGKDYTWSEHDQVMKAVELFLPYGSFGKPFVTNISGQLVYELNNIQAEIIRCYFDKERMIKTIAGAAK